MNLVHAPIGEGPGLEKQACSISFFKYLFLNLNWIDVKALEIRGLRRLRTMRQLELKMNFFVTLTSHHQHLSHCASPLVHYLTTNPLASGHSKVHKLTHTTGIFLIALVMHYSTILWPLDNMDKIFLIGSPLVFILISRI